MGERSIFTNFLLIALIVVLAVGVYWTVDALSILNRSVQTGVRAVDALGNQLGQLQRTIDRKEFAAAVSPGESAAPKRDKPPFANLDIRDPDAVDGGYIVQAMGSESHNLNYIVNNESSVSEFWSMANDSLATRNLLEPDTFEPQLAVDWEISEDKKTYLIKLRKGVYWHNFTDPTTGESFRDVEVTANDFAFFVEVMRNPDVPCAPLRGYYKDLDALEVIDEHTFRVTWKEPYFLSESLTLGLSPLPRHFYRFKDTQSEFVENVERNRMIVGCGPWQFESWDRGRELVFRRFENYYGPKPHLLERRIRVIQEPSARLLALRNGEVDRVGLLPDQWVDQTNDAGFEDKFDKFKYSARAYSYIGYNMRRKPFDDRRVRLAMTHLVNRERILRDVYRGLGQIVTGNFYINTPFYDKSIRPWPFDIDKARELLAEAGWSDTDGDGILDKDGEDFEFTFMAITGSKLQERVAAIIKEDFARAGIVMNVLSVEWSVYTQRLDSREFDVCSLGWNLGYESDPYQVWHSSQAELPRGSNHVGFVNEEADKIIESAREVFDLDKRIEMYHRFHEILHEEQPYTFLVTPDSLVAQHHRYRNARVYPIGTMDVNTFWVPLEEQRTGD